MKSLCVLLMTTVGAMASSGVTDAVANKTFRCGQRGFWVTLTFGPDGRSYQSLNSIGEPGHGIVTWDERGDGKTVDPEDPRFSVNSETGQFALQGQTCVPSAPER